MTYATGSLTLTNGSTTVAGVGTAWVNAIRAGWLLLIPGEGPLLVASVEAAGSLTIARPYQGSSRAGQVYNAVPTQGQIAPFATQLQALIDSYQSVKDNAGQGKFPDGTLASPGMRFTADENTGWHRPAADQLAGVVGGVLRMLLSSTGLAVTGLISGTAVTQSQTDATAGRLLKVGDFGLGGQAPSLPANTDINTATIPSGAHVYSTAQGHTNGPAGVANATLFRQQRAADVFQDRMVADWPGAVGGNTYTRYKISGAFTAWRLQYGQGNILGAVSQSGGVPSGAIIERGSNANGSFTRFADGTMICTHTLAGSAGGAATWTFPGAFIAAPVVTGTAVATVASTVCLDAAPTATAATFSARDKTDARRADTCHMIARGNWF